MVHVSSELPRWCAPRTHLALQVKKEHGRRHIVLLGKRQRLKLLRIIGSLCAVKAGEGYRVCDVQLLPH
jgi:hypothetical protein